jgi:hypothetical protein
MMQPKYCPLEKFTQCNENCALYSNTVDDCSIHEIATGIYFFNVLFQSFIDAITEKDSENNGRD